MFDKLYLIELIKLLKDVDKLMQTADNDTFETLYSLANDLTQQIEALKYKLKKEGLI